MERFRHISACGVIFHFFTTDCIQEFMTIMVFTSIITNIPKPSNVRYTHHNNKLVFTMTSESKKCIPLPRPLMPKE